MQGAQASCGSGGSDPPDIPFLSPTLSKIPPRPSISLELYERFAEDAQPSSPSLIPPSVNPHSLMDFEPDDSAQGAPPSADDAIDTAIASSSLSARSSITTPRVSETMGNNRKSSSKRVITTVSPSASASKKPSPATSKTSINSLAQDSLHSDPSASASSNVSLSSLSLRYNNKDRPPYVVQVQSTVESSPPHPFYISRILSQIYPREILEIRKLGLGKVLVQLNSYESANRLVNNHSLTASNLRAFIPSYRVLRTGVVRDIPQDVSIETLKECISSPIKILEIHRLNRRLKTGNDIQYVPSRTLCVKFAGQFLPNFIYFHNCRFSVSPFIPKTRICFSCFRVGHLSKTCKGRPRCLHCGELQHSAAEACPSKHSPARCINCGGDHLATSHECPRVLHHKTALSLAATENISLTEALRLVNSSPPYSSGSPSSNPQDPRFDFTNFPYLPRQRPSPISDPDISLSNRFSPLSNLSPSSNDLSFYSSISKPYSLAAKNSNLNPSHSLNRPHPSSRSNLISGHSGSPASVLRHPYPKAHRDLLLNPNGRTSSSAINSSALLPSSQPLPQELNTSPPHSDSSLADIHRLLISHSKLLRHLYDLLGGSFPPLPVVVHDTSRPSLIPSLPPSFQEPHHPSLRSHASPTPP